MGLEGLKQGSRSEPGIPAASGFPSGLQIRVDLVAEEISSDSEPGTQLAWSSGCTTLP